MYDFPEMMIYLRNGFLFKFSIETRSEVSLLKKEILTWVKFLRVKITKVARCVRMVFSYLITLIVVTTRSNSLRVATIQIQQIKAVPVINLS